MSSGWLDWPLEPQPLTLVQKVSPHSPLETKNLEAEKVVEVHEILEERSSPITNACLSEKTTIRMEEMICKLCIV
jgi:hypothetical protein